MFAATPRPLIERRRYGLQVSRGGFVGSGARASATARSAARKGTGNAFPRFSARRNIPAQAFALK
jgi:hypothetical protein